MGIEEVGEYQYNTNDKLGSGHFGDVFKGCKKEDKTFIVAIKVLERSLESEYELEALKKLKDNPHDNIVIFHDYYKLPGTLVLVMEYCNGGTLAAYKKEARIDDKTLCIFTQQLTNAIKHFHSLGIVHRDLKPDNILLKDSSATLTLKIADFGTARWIGIKGWPYPCPTDYSYSAHPAENCSFKVYQTVDTFSVGRIIRSLVEGQPPSNSPERAKLQKIIKGLENEDPTKRMTAEKVLRILSLQPKDDEQPYDDEQPNDDNSLLAAKSSEFAATSSIFTSVSVPILMKFAFPFCLVSLVLLMIVIVLDFIFKMIGKFSLRKQNEISTLTHWNIDTGLNAYPTYPTLCM